jgi:hypothetical protein
MKRTHDLFVSYSSRDQETAKAIVTTLQADGVRCWFAEHSLGTSDDFNEDIVRAIEQARLVVVVVSDDADRSDYVKNEVQQAVNLKKPILPFCVSPSLSGFFALHLSRRQRLDATKGTLDENIGRLSTYVRDRLQRQSRGKAITSQRKSSAATTHVADAVTIPLDGGAPLLPQRRVQFYNPYDFSAPANELTFKGRSRELNELVDAIQSCTHTAIFGLQRMGKTSLVEEGLRSRLEADPELAQSLLFVGINFHFEGDDQLKYRDLGGRILRGVAREIAKAGIGHSNEQTDAVIREVLSPSRQYDRGDRSEFFERFANCMRALARASRRRVVLFLDEFSEVAHGIQKNRLVSLRKPLREMNLLAPDQYVDAKFLHFLGTLLKEREFSQLYTLVIAVRPFMAEFDDRENLQMLKLMTSVTLDYLGESEAKSLIIEPVRGVIDYSDESVDYLWRLTAGHPYLLQYILKNIVNRLNRQGRNVLELDDVMSMEQRMTSEATAYEAVFEVLMSDYSVQEVLHPQEANLGKGTLAIISKLGDAEPQWWVSLEQFAPQLTRHMPKEKLMSVLSQLCRTKILDERDSPSGLQFRLHVPLLHKRFVKQNMYGKYFA